jgi:hypothetical protein
MAPWHAAPKHQLPVVKLGGETTVAIALPVGVYGVHEPGENWYSVHFPLALYVATTRYHPPSLLFAGPA